MIVVRSEAQKICACSPLWICHTSDGGAEILSYTKHPVGG